MSDIQRQILKCFHVYFQDLKKLEDLTTTFPNGIYLFPERLMAEADLNFIISYFNSLIHIRP